MKFANDMLRAQYETASTDGARRAAWLDRVDCLEAFAGPAVQYAPRGQAPTFLTADESRLLSALANIEVYGGYRPAAANEPTVAPLRRTV